MRSCIFLFPSRSPFQFLLVSSCSVVPHKQIICQLVSRSFEALYTAIKSPFSLLFSRVESFSLENLSSYGKSLRHGAIFVPVLCILSIFLISFFSCGDQITIAYSNFSQINDVINFLNISSSRYLKAILIFLSI